MDDCKNDYTVVGIDVITGQRYADHFRSECAEGAEQLAMEDAPHITICGVFAGKLDAEL